MEKIAIIVNIFLVCFLPATILGQMIIYKNGKDLSAYCPPFNLDKCVCRYHKLFEIPEEFKGVWKVKYLDPVREKTWTEEEKSLIIQKGQVSSRYQGAYLVYAQKIEDSFYYVLFYPNIPSAMNDVYRISKVYIGSRYKYTLEKAYEFSISRAMKNLNVDRVGTEFTIRWEDLVEQIKNDKIKFETMAELER